MRGAAADPSAATVRPPAPRGSSPKPKPIQLQNPAPNSRNPIRSIITPQRRPSAGPAISVKSSGRLYREMKTEPDVLCYTTAIDALVAVIRPAEAEKVFEEMVDSGIRVEPDNVAYTIIVKLYSCYVKRFESGHEVFRRMARCGCDPDVVNLSTRITGLCWAGRVTKAWGLFDQMLQRKCTPDAHSYSFHPLGLLLSRKD